MNVNLLNRNTSIFTLPVSRAVNSDQHRHISASAESSFQPLQTWTDLSVLTYGLQIGSISAVKPTLGINIWKSACLLCTTVKILQPQHSRLIKDNLFQHDTVGGMQILSGVTQLQGAEFPQDSERSLTYQCLPSNWKVTRGASFSTHFLLMRGRDPPASYYLK